MRQVSVDRLFSDNRERLESLPLGTYAIVSPLLEQAGNADAIPPGAIFCLRAVGDTALNAAEPNYPLNPHFLVHVGEDGEVLLSYTQAKQVLDRLKKLCIGRDLPYAEACGRFDQATRFGRDMESYQKLLARAVSSIVGKSEELFALGRIQAGASAGRAIDELLRENRVWGPRQRPMKAAATRVKPTAVQRSLALAAGIDRAAKGVGPGDPWDELLKLGLGLGER